MPSGHHKTDEACGACSLMRSLPLGAQQGKRHHLDLPSPRRKGVCWPPGGVTCLRCVTKTGTKVQHFRQ